MSKLSKILLIACLVVCFSFTLCYGIDLNLTENNAQASNSSSNTNVNTNSNSNTYTNSKNASNSASGNVNNTNNNTNTTTKSNNQAATVGTATLQDYNASTITNIINIALIVVGVLLIFFAIAILIRLGKR